MSVSSSHCRQVVLVDEMTVALLPVIRDRDGPKWLEFLIAYFVAIMKAQG